MKAKILDGKDKGKLVNLNAFTWRFLEGSDE